MTVAAFEGMSTLTLSYELYWVTDIGWILTGYNFSFIYQEAR